MTPHIDIPEQRSATMNYVAGFLIDPFNRLLLVEKQKPDWQAGRLNGIGGKIEFAEEPMDAMIREWREETGDDFTDWYEFCKLDASDHAVVHFFKGRTVVPHHARLIKQDKNDVGERLLCIDTDMVHRHRTIPNLLWLIPLAFCDAYEPVAMVINRR
jgi:8-oxo-dGTP diphosphatase